MKRLSAKTSFERIGRFVLHVPRDKNLSSIALRYGVAALCVLIAFGIRLALDPLLQSRATFILFVPAIIIAAWHGGIGPALAAILGTFLLTNYFFIEPFDQWNPLKFPEFVAAVTYLFSALVVIGLVNALHRERERVLTKARLLAQEVEERKSIEKRLREGDERLRAILENSPTMIFLKDNDGRYLLGNRELEKITHLPTKAIIGKTDDEIFAPEQAAAFRANDRQILEHGKPMRFEEVAFHDDSLHTSIVHKFPLRDSAGKIYAIGGIVTDITERKQIEEALQRSEELLLTTVDGANIDLWSWDSVNDVFEYRRVAEAHYGRTDEPLRLQTFLEHVHLEDRRWVNEEIQSCLRDGHNLNIEYRILSPEGTLRWHYSKGTPALQNGQVVRISGMSMDITPRKLAESALRKSEALLRLTTEGANVGLWSWDIVNNVVEWNEIEFRQFGLPLDTPLSLEVFLDCVHPDDRNFLSTEIETCLREHRELNLEHRIQRRDGTVRWNQCKGRPSYANERAVRFSGMSLDITERKENEEALRRHVELVDLAQVLVFDLNDRILFWNRGTEKLYGWSKSEAIGANCHELLRTEFQEPLHEIKKKVFESNFWEGELTHYRKDGQKINVASLWAVHKDSQNRPVAILQSDNNITELKKVEEDLQEVKGALEQRVERRTDQLQKSLKDMESFCYTIAHDLRAPLRSMSGFSQSLTEDFGPQLGPTGEDYCERIRAAAARMSQLISDLLVFGRLTHRQLPSESVDLLTEIEKVLTRTAPQIEECHAKITVDKPLPKVCGDAPVLDQILENLIVNAVKFVPPDRSPDVRIYAEHHEGNVRICIEDNGIGILPEHWQKIFRPFERLHTGDYPGTGIGLAIVQRGVEKMGGQVGVESTPKKGSRFWVELPEQCKRSDPGTSQPAADDLQ